MGSREYRRDETRYRVRYLWIFFLSLSGIIFLVGTAFRLLNGSFSFMILAMYATSVLICLAGLLIRRGSFYGGILTVFGIMSVGIFASAVIETPRFLYLPVLVVPLMLLIMLRSYLLLSAGAVLLLLCEVVLFHLSGDFSINQLVFNVGLLLTAYIILLFITISQRHAEDVRIRQAEDTVDATVYILGYTAELKDEQTGSHLDRVSTYVRLLAREALVNRYFREYIDERYIEDLEKSAPLHDIGKVAIPDSILLKPGKLTEEEFALIKTHTSRGAEILTNAQERLRFESVFDIAISMARSHHERWDGAGYPEGLKGEEIPISARIMAIADVYDALRSDRPYKSALSHRESVEIIEQGAGSQFDPDLVRFFLIIDEAFEEVSIALKPGGSLEKSGEIQ